MDARERQLVRAVIKQVHPDVLAHKPLEQAHNTEALKALNTYIDRLVQRKVQPHQRISFFALVGDKIQSTEVVLPASGNLRPLFHAFGLITAQELDSVPVTAGEADVNFLQWLADTVSEAAKTAEEHQALQSTIDQLCTAIEVEHNLLLVQVGVLSSSKQKQLQSLEALQTLQQSLRDFSKSSANQLEGLAIHLQLPGPLAQCEIDDDGCLYLPADASAIQHALSNMDLDEARLQTQRSGLQAQQVRDLTLTLREMLNVEDVWCWTTSQAMGARFVAWAQKVLDLREQYARQSQESMHKFRIMVHSDLSMPMLEFVESFGALQVSTECDAHLLLDYLSGDAASTASVASLAQERARLEEERLLKAACSALRAKHIIRVCSVHDHPQVCEAIQRLISNAAAVRQAVDLSGVTIAIDTCYEVWDSGIISVPWNFNINELRPQLIKLLASGHAPTPATSKSTYPEAVRTAGCFSHNLSSRVQCFGSQTQSYLSGVSTAKQVHPTAHCIKSLNVRSGLACQNTKGSVVTSIRPSYVPSRQWTCMYAHGSNICGAVQNPVFMQNTSSKLLRRAMPTRAIALTHLSCL